MADLEERVEALEQLVGELILRQQRAAAELIGGDAIFTLDDCEGEA